MKPTDKAIALLKPVLEWLDALSENRQTEEHPNHFFDMSDFYESDYEHQNSCGTASCIAGAVAAFNNLEGIPIFDHHMVAIGKVAEAMEMNWDNASALFYAAAYPVTMSNYIGAESLLSHGKLEDVTPAEAATAIRKWISTGEVDWSHV